MGISYFRFGGANIFCQVGDDNEPNPASPAALTYSFLHSLLPALAFQLDMITTRMDFSPFPHLSDARCQHLSPFHGRGKFGSNSSLSIPFLLTDIYTSDSRVQSFIGSSLFSTYAATCVKSLISPPRLSPSTSATIYLIKWGRGIERPTSTTKRP